MRTAEALVDDLVRGIIDDGSDVLTLDLIDRRAAEFGAVAAAADAGSPKHDIAGAVERHLTAVSRAVRAEAFRL